MRASRLLTSVRLLRLNSSDKVQCLQIQSGLCSTSYSTLSPILCYNLPTLSTHNLLSPAPFSTGNVLGKKTADELLPDTEVYLVDHKDNRTPIKYAELQAKAGSRQLVRVSKKKTKASDLPEFKIMSDVDLEIALRKARNATGLQKKHREVIKTESGGRVKLKVVEVSYKISEHDLKVQLAKIHKWLVKGDFVNVNIKAGRNGVGKPEAEALEKTILDEFSEVPELTGDAKLKIDIR